MWSRGAQSSAEAYTSHINLPQGLSVSEGLTTEKKRAITSFEFYKAQFYWAATDSGELFHTRNTSISISKKWIFSELPLLRVKEKDEMKEPISVWFGLNVFFLFSLWVAFSTFSVVLMCQKVQQAETSLSSYLWHLESPQSTNLHEEKIEIWAHLPKLGQNSSLREAVCNPKVSFPSHKLTWTK